MEPSPETATYHIARDGKVIGVYAFPTLLEKFRAKAVLATDHYHIEGSADWKLVGELKPQFDAYEQEQKDKAKRLKAEAEAAEEAEKARKKKENEESWAKEERERLAAIKAEAERILKEDEMKASVPWKCHTCASVFPRKLGDKNYYPEPQGTEQARDKGLTAGFLIAVGLAFTAIPIFGIIICAVFLLIALPFLIESQGYIIALGTERGLQQFHSYRPKCPKCSSTYCSSQAEGPPDIPSTESPPPPAA